MNAHQKENERHASQYEADPDELQRREAVYLAEAVMDALGAVYDLKTTLIKLRDAGGTNYLEDVYLGARFKLTLREILSQMAEELEQEVD